MTVEEIIQNAVETISDKEGWKEKNWLFALIEKCVYDCINAFNGDDDKGE